MIAASGRYWEHFFHRQVPPHLLAIVRIALGLYLMLYWATQWIQAPLFSVEYGVIVPLYKTVNYLSAFFFHPSLAFMHGVFACIFLLLLCFTAGWRTRTSAFFLLVFFAYYHILTEYLFASSFTRIFEYALLVFLLPGGDGTFSVAMLRKHGSLLAWEPVSILSQRFLAMQVTVTYFGVGFQKLLLPAWKSGAILRYGFTGRWATPFAFWLAQRLPESAYDPMLLGVKILECSIPFGLWIPRVRGWFFVGGFIFHTMITLTLGIWWFQFLIPLYIIFLDPEDVYRYVRSMSGGRIR